MLVFFSPKLTNLIVAIVIFIILTRFIKPQDKLQVNFNWHQHIFA